MTQSYPLLGEVLSGQQQPQGGCCELGPSYACFNCGRRKEDKTSAAKEATEHFREVYGQ